MNSVDKSTLRQELIRARQALPHVVWKQKSQQLCGYLQNSRFFAQAQTVLAYFSMRQEPDLSSLWDTNLTKCWGFPRCQGTSLIWHAWLPGDAAQIGTYGIWEPDPDLPILAAEQVDLILVPAIACDIQGYRLGYGGGFYDRLLSLPEWQSKPTIGLVFESAYLTVLPVDPWDKPLAAVCTETGFYYPSNGQGRL